MMDITGRLQNLMHVESAGVAPHTNETIEIAREAKAEIERLRTENERLRAAVARAIVQRRRNALRKLARR